MKKKILTIAVLVICLAILGSSTLAYVTDKEIAHNVITSRGVDITLVEQMKEGESWVEFEDPSGVMPGTSVSKKVTVKSAEDSASAWVRIRVSSEDLDMMELDINKEAWEEHGEGIYYYKEILPADSETPHLFQNVSFVTGMGDTYQNKELKLHILAEAVQSDNNIPESGDPWDAEGWNDIQSLLRKLIK